MGIFGAMLTAVSGLRAQSYSLENISGNIANTQTAGYKRVDTSFVDLIADRPARQEIAGSVAAYSQLTNTLQGDLLPTGISTNMAINGNGFFAVQERTGYSDNTPIFGSVDLYTRRGDFSLDKDGYLVNGAGYYLNGASINPATGEVSSANGVIQISKDPVPARATATIEYGAILPSNPRTAASDTTVAGSELLFAPPVTPGVFTPFSTDPRFAGDGYVRADERTDFLNRSIAGGSIIIYNEIGNPIDTQLRWAKTSNTAGAETWDLFYQADSTATGATPMWRSLGTSSFDATGRLTSASTMTFPAGATINGVPVAGVEVAFGGNLTQFADVNGLIQGSTLQQDGYAAGTLGSVLVSSDGRISGQYTNGRVLPIAQVSVVQFNAPNMLSRRDGGAYEQTRESGVPLGSLEGSSIVGGSVEQSNTDIAEEFSKMIVTQQAYSANTRVVTTAQSMMQDVINMVR